jgi:glycerate 2-kinase
MKGNTISDLVSKVLRLSDPKYWLAKKVRVQNGEVSVNGERYLTKRPLLISVGKASVPMAEYFLERIKPIRAIVVTPVSAELDAEVLVAEHPLPGAGSLKAGDVVEEALAREDYDLVLFLVSGGASALMEKSDLTLEELREINRVLVGSGLSINEINVVRKHLSHLKGGQLARLSKAKVLTLAVSDVPGNDPSSIGSGPTVPDTSTVEQAEEIMERVGLTKYVRFLRETPKSLPNSKFYLLFDALDVLKEGFNDWLILTGEAKGEATSLGAILASIANSSERTGIERVAMAGEPEVKLSGKVGKGGRNGEVCLGYYLNSRAKGFTLVAIASDGSDGNSEYAGCYVDDLDLERGEVLEALENHDSYGLLEKYDRTIKTGFTFTNVNNFYFLFRQSR